MTCFKLKNLKFGNCLEIAQFGNWKFLFCVATFLAFASQAHAGLILGAPKYVGLGNGLVGYWSFNGPDMNATKVLDSSGQGNHGTLTNMDVKKSTVAGRIGQALSFDGSNDFVSVSSAVITAPPFTFCTWFNINNSTALKNQNAKL